MPRPPVALPHAVIDLEAREIRAGGVAHALTDLEVSLLAFLLDRAGEVVSRELLLVEVWGYRPGVATRAVDNTVVRLRTKLEPDPANPTLLRTIRGGGYRFDLPPGARAPRAKTLPLPTNTNLTPEGDRFVGRQVELDGLRASLEVGGLTSLVGPGGAGKTRLAREVALGASAELTGGAWFVDLSDVHAPSAMPSAVALALGVSAPRAGDPQETTLQIGRALRARGPMLLVLDNLEQLLPAATEALEAWRAPELRLWLTSRSAAGLAGERVIPVGPLGPDDAMALFESRARRVRPGFRLDHQSRASVRELVARLDHLPLAVELAAAWTDVLTPDRVLTRLERAATLAARGRNDGRHASLDAALTWSWDMLSPALVRALEAAAAFRGGFDLEAAEAVIGPTALDDLEALRARSLVRFTHASHQPDEPRFNLLLSVIDFAGRKLEQSGRGPAVHRAHLEWYLALGERLTRGQEPDAAPRLGLELDNLLAAARRFRGVSPEASSRCALAADLALAVRGPLSLRLSVLEDAVGQSDAAGSVELRVRARAARADALCALGRAEEAAADLRAARELGGACLTLAQRATLSHGEAIVAQGRGDLRLAGQLAEEATRAAAGSGEPRVQASTGHLLAMIRLEQGDLDGAERAARAALEAASATSDLLGSRATISAQLGAIALSRGRLAEALTHLSEALQMHRDANNRWGEAVVLGNLATALFEDGRLERAERAYQEAIAGHRAVGNRRFEGMCLSNAGALAWRMGNAPLGRERLGQAIAVHASVKNPRSRAYALFNLAVLEHEAGRVAEAAERLEELAGLVRDIGDRRLSGVTQVWRAVILTGQGRRAEAQALIDGPEAAEAPVERDLVIAALGSEHDWARLRAAAEERASVQTKALISALNSARA